jgi:hypothetical protein
MRMPASVQAAQNVISSELEAEAKKARRMYDFCSKAQTAQYIEAAKAVNAKLRQAGLNSLCLVEA